MPREKKPPIEYDFDEEVEARAQLIGMQELLKRHAEIATQNKWPDKATKLLEIARGIRAFEVTLDKRPDRDYLHARS